MSWAQEPNDDIKAAAAALEVAEAVTVEPPAVGSLSTLEKRDYNRLLREARVRRASCLADAGMERKALEDFLASNKRAAKYVCVCMCGCVRMLQSSIAALYIDRSRVPSPWLCVLVRLMVQV